LTYFAGVRKGVLCIGIKKQAANVKGVVSKGRKFEGTSWWLANLETCVGSRIAQHFRRKALERHAWN
jgi:hypothetical protein